MNFIMSDSSAPETSLPDASGFESSSPAGRTATNPSSTDTIIPSDSGIPPANLSPASSIANIPNPVSNNSSSITNIDFVNNTRTELPFSDSDLTVADLNATTEAPALDTDYSADANDTYNPFLANDYDYYYFNPDVEREPYDYTQVDEDAKREEVLALWKNVDIPPAVNYQDFTPRDLDPYFLVLPPVLCLAFLLLVFVPCFVLKLRDDIREISGKDRKWGSKRYHKQKKVTHESFQAIDPEWQLSSGAKDVSGNAFRDVQYVKPGASGSSNTYDKSNGSAMSHAKENPAYVEENEVCTRQPKSSSRTDPPVDYSEEEITSAGGDDLEDSDDARADRKAGNAHTNISVDDGNANVEDNSASSPATTYPKFTGWNKDLYSNGAGFGPPAKKADGKPADGPEDPTWGMY